MHFTFDTDPDFKLDFEDKYDLCLVFDNYEHKTHEDSVDSETESGSDADIIENIIHCGEFLL